MENDFITIIGNLTKSLLPIQALIAGLSYCFGIAFFITALFHLHKIGGTSRSSNAENTFVPIAYLLAGTALVFLPSAMGGLANTAFGTGNILQYTDFNRLNIINSMNIMIKTAGLLWFVRGCVLLAHASEPGVQHGSKGMAFLCAGVLANNFQSTIVFLNWAMDKLASLR